MFAEIGAAQCPSLDDNELRDWVGAAAADQDQRTALLLAGVLTLPV